MTIPDADELLGRVHLAVATLGRPVQIMEVCGTHTMAVARSGLRSLLPPDLRLLSGPGCPVCVTSQRDIERMVALANLDGVTVCSFGDMLRVPARGDSLEEARAAGADVRILYSPEETLRLAAAEPDRGFVFLGVGFETTAPLVAAVVAAALQREIPNFSVYTAHKLIPPAMAAVLEGGSRVDAFLTPGHVSTIIGSQAYAELARAHGVPCVATGFEPTDILEGLALAIEKLIEGDSGSHIQYTRAVRPGGNPRARAIMEEVFDVADVGWRGLGTIPMSGLKLRPAFERFDAAIRFALPEAADVPTPGCRCGDVLKGILDPEDCALFGKACTPDSPAGPCMVSTEGACAARHRYG